ncbi:MAG TPA: hypothetical protein VGK40_07340 [Verrucomicrobiae bacterium]|jgi:hypothetical protein
MKTEPESHTLQLPCRHLRSKEMYYQSPGQEDDAFSSGIYWCTQTHEAVGPDSQPCGKKECCAGRNCFVS